MALVLVHGQFILLIVAEARLLKILWSVVTFTIIHPVAHAQPANSLTSSLSEEYI